MQPLLQQHSQLKTSLKNTNVRGRIILGVVLVILGLGWLFVVSQWRVPLLILGVGAVCASAGAYGIYTGIKDIPSEREFGTAVTIAFTPDELDGFEETFEGITQQSDGRLIDTQLQTQLAELIYKPKAQIARVQRANPVLTLKAFEWSILLVQLATLDCLGLRLNPVCELAFMRIFQALPLTVQRGTRAHLAALLLTPAWRSKPPA